MARTMVSKFAIDAMFSHFHYDQDNDPVNLHTVLFLNSRVMCACACVCACALPILSIKRVMKWKPIKRDLEFQGDKCSSPHWRIRQRATQIMDAGPIKARGVGSKRGSRDNICHFYHTHDNITANKKCE